MRATGARRVLPQTGVATPIEARERHICRNRGRPTRRLRHRLPGHAGPRRSRASVPSPSAVSAANPVGGSPRCIVVSARKGHRGRPSQALTDSHGQFDRNGRMHRCRRRRETRFDRVLREVWLPQDLHDGGTVSTTVPPGHRDPTSRRTRSWFLGSRDQARSNPRSTLSNATPQIQTEATRALLPRSSRTRSRDSRGATASPELKVAGSICVEAHSWAAVVAPVLSAGIAAPLSGDPLGSGVVIDMPLPKSTDEVKTHVQTNDC